MAEDKTWRRARRGGGKTRRRQDAAEARRGGGKTWRRVRRGNEFLRCGAQTPSFDLRRKRVKGRKEKSCPGAGRDWAFRPTA